MLLPMILKNIHVEEEIKGEFDGVQYDAERYDVEMRSGLATHEYSVMVNHATKQITGDVIEYGSWDDMELEDCLELLQIVEKEGKLVRSYKDCI